MTELEFLGIIPEILVGLVLGGFAWAFKSWAHIVKESSNIILEKLETLYIEFHAHRLDTEKRITRNETLLDNMERRMTRCESLEKKRNGTSK
jgi:hypothetical protein